MIPRWGLVERFDTAEFEQHAEPRRGPSIAALRATLIATIAVLGLAALVHMVRYVLLIVNRDVLLNPAVAWLATWFGVLVSAAALFLVFATFVLLTNWLIARRAAAFKHVRRQEHRPLWALRAGCLVPFVNLAWAPVFVLELASAEDALARLRRPITVWWVVWVLSTAVSVFSIATSFTRDAQGIADNTVSTIVAYLIAMATMVLVGRVLLGFERRPVEKPAKRWVIVSDESPREKPNPAFRLSPKARTRQHSRMNSGDAEAGQGLGGHPFVVAHRGASADRPEHTLAAYELALQEGADGVECDVRLTKDGHLVCVHDRRVDRTSNGTGLVSEMSLAQLKALDYGSWHASWRADGSQGDTGLLTLDDLVSLVLDWHRPVKIFVETKHPVRYGALVESKVLALLHRYGIASPASADLSRAVVMSFSAAAVWRIRRAAPMLPTVLLGETSRYLGGSAATTVGATAVGPSIATLREHPELVDRAAAQGRALYCWTVDHYEDVRYCRELGVAWVATNHPGRTKDWLQNGLTGAGLD